MPRRKNVFQTRNNARIAFVPYDLVRLDNGEMLEAQPVDKGVEQPCYFCALQNSPLCQRVCCMTPGKRGVIFTPISEEMKKQILESDKKEAACW